MKTRSTWHGFTLIELLVVVGIIAVLLAILLPVLTSTRESARSTACTSNLRQLSAAFLMYTDDYDGYFPPNGVHELRSLPDIDLLWIRQIQPYVRNDGVLHCPSDNVNDGRRTFSNNVPALWNYHGVPALSYGANWDLMNEASTGRAAGNLHLMPYQSQTLLVSDCEEPWAFGPVYFDGQQAWSHIAYANAPPVAHSSTVLHGGHSGAGQERHRDGSNVAFADGHMRFMHASEFVNGVDEMTKKLIQRPIISGDAEPPGTAGSGG